MPYEAGVIWGEEYGLMVWQKRIEFTKQIGSR